MSRLLPILLLPIAELWVLLELGGKVGAWPVLMWCIATGLLGMWILRREASALTGFLRSAQRDTRAGLRPARFELGRHGLVAMAGVFFAFPGVLSDALALVLLFVAMTKRSDQDGAMRARRSAQAPDVEVLPPGEVESPFEKRPRIIDVE